MQKVPRVWGWMHHIHTLGRCLPPPPPRVQICSPFCGLAAQGACLSQRGQILLPTQMAPKMVLSANEISDPVQSYWISSSCLGWGARQAAANNTQVGGAATPNLLPALWPLEGSGRQICNLCKGWGDGEDPGEAPEKLWYWAARAVPQPKQGSATAVNPARTTEMELT